MVANAQRDGGSSAQGTAGGALAADGHADCAPGLSVSRAVVYPRQCAQRHPLRRGSNCFDRPALLAAARDACSVVTVEEHWRSGGLGSLVAEELTGTANPERVWRIGVDDRLVPGAGDQQHLLARTGITREAVVGAARSLFRRPRP